MLAIKSGPAKREAGFTLIELMVTLTIAAVLMVVVAPNLSTFKRNAELTSATNTLVGAINTARGEAMKRGMNAFVVPTNNGSSWNSGWVVFIDNNRTQAYDATTDQTILVQDALPGYFTVSGNNSASGSTPYIMFDASGYSKLKTGGFGALTLTLTRTDLSASDQVDQTRRIIIAKTGRTRSCKPASATDTSCAASSVE
jgi:type IV fimbrial biogenesis protein FimT